MALPAASDLPLMGELRDIVLGPVADAPLWVQSLVWAVVAFAALLGTAMLFVRFGFPFLARILPRPLSRLIDVVGVVLVAPEFGLTTVVRWLGQPLPRSLISYGDAVHQGVVAAETLTRRGLHHLHKLRTTSLPVIALALLGLTGAWNYKYCSGRDRACETPTSEWASSVSVWFDSDER